MANAQDASGKTMVDVLNGLKIKSFHCFSQQKNDTITLGKAQRRGRRSAIRKNHMLENIMKKCWICGKDGAEHRNIGKRDPLFYDLIPFSEDSQRCYCPECFNEAVEQYKKDVKEYARLKKKLMFERAVRILEQQDLNIYDYEEAIKAVEEFAAEKPDKFDSAYEMIAAIILVDNEIPCELQHKIGKYQCDFYIPSMKVVLEIDGERHKGRKGYDSARDERIIKELGRGWNIVRIRTEYLDENADLLVEAIKTILEERKK